MHAKTRNGGAWPIIDIFNESVATALGTAARLRAEFSAGKIRIPREESYRANQMKQACFYTTRVKLRHRRLVSMGRLDLRKRTSPDGARLSARCQEQTLAFDRT